MLVKDSKINDCFMFVENMSKEEVRKTFYKRREGIPLYPNNIAVWRYRTEQGEPNDTPRYLWNFQPPLDDDGNVIDIPGIETEVDGRVPVVMI
jgi:hypothetical protein